MDLCSFSVFWSSWLPLGAIWARFGKVWGSILESFWVCFWKVLNSILEVFGDNLGLRLLLENSRTFLELLRTFPEFSTTYLEFSKTSLVKHDWRKRKTKGMKRTETWNEL